MPKIDVLLAIFNGEKYLSPAIRSILAQTFTDFRLICIDDGSTDSTAAILRSFAQQDRRVLILSQENKGLVAALNAGLKICTAPFVARMDHDDIAMPERFARQVAYLEKHPNVVVLGTAIFEMDSDSDPLGVQCFPLEHDLIDFAMVRLDSCMAHPTVMMRREALQSVGGYRSQYEFVEDLDLWLRMGEIGELANLAEPLLWYRQHGGSISWSRNELRKERVKRILKEAYERRGLECHDAIISRLNRSRSPVSSSKWARKAAKNKQPLVALKHMREQWRAAPTKFLTWRMSFEILLRLMLAYTFSNKSSMPAIPRYDDEPDGRSPVRQEYRHQ